MEIERIDSRLTKWADKRRNGAASTANDDVDTVVSKAQQKAAQKAIDLVEDLDNYRSEYTEAGQQMVKTAVAPIASLVKRFHDDVGQKYIWLENVRVKDWTRELQLPLNQTEANNANHITRLPRDGKAREEHS